jgi:Protein of unknown function (DUF1003)/Integrase core domain
VQEGSSDALGWEPLLARRMKLTGVDQLWVADITYIRLKTEFVYLAVILDGFSRKVVGWSLERTLASCLVMAALEEAIATRKPPPGLVAWLLINSGKIPGARPFDPYPFSLLGVIVAVEAVILSSFILMRQNRMMRRGERRDHLNLQVDLLAEKEITKLLQMVRAICGQMGLQNIMADKEIRDLSQNTSIESLSQTLEDRLPGI